ncbi:MAG: ribosomal L7Ae/L30e/S12e/Gadd45 family protein [Clostridia bacterium]|nr:ribosomal L7Ae/L30e/S12e/Gadd45 family protein [Clostridia bacterium]
MQGLSQGERIVAGTRQALREISQGRAKRVYIALDAQERILSEARAAAEKAGVPVEEISDMAALGRRCRIQVPCAVAVLAVTEG